MVKIVQRMLGAILSTYIVCCKKLSSSIFLGTLEIEMKRSGEVIKKDIKNYLKNSDLIYAKKNWR